MGFGTMGNRYVEVECKNCDYGTQWPVQDEDRAIHVDLSCCPYCTNDVDGLMRWIGLQSEQAVRYVNARKAGADLDAVIHLTALEMRELSKNIVDKNPWYYGKL